MLLRLPLRQLGELPASPLWRVSWHLQPRRLSVLAPRAAVALGTLLVLVLPLLLPQMLLRQLLSSLPPLLHPQGLLPQTRKRPHRGKMAAARLLPPPAAQGLPAASGWRLLALTPPSCAGCWWPRLPQSASWTAGQAGGASKAGM
jgi:hypothetical protein